MHTQLVLIFLFFFLLAQNQMEMVNRRTVPLAITKHLMIASNLSAVALRLHSGGSRCSRCLSLTPEFLISHRLPGQAMCLSLTKTTTLDYRNPASWRCQTALKNAMSVFWQNPCFFSIFPIFILHYWRFSERHRAVQGKLGREEKGHQKK